MVTTKIYDVYVNESIFILYIILLLIRDMMMIRDNMILGGWR